jgi:hypothetical protein
VAYTCTASRWLYHNMSKSQLGIDLGDLSITSRCWSLSRSPTRLCLSVVWRNDTQWGRNIRSDHLPSILALLFIIWLFDRRRKKQTIKNVQHVVCVCLSRHSIACAPGPCNPSWTLFLYYMMKTFTSSPTTTTLVFSSIFLLRPSKEDEQKK